MKKSSKILAGTALMASLITLSGCAARPQVLYAPPAATDMPAIGLETDMPEETPTIPPVLYGPPAMDDVLTPVPTPTPEIAPGTDVPEDPDDIEELYGPPPFEEEAEE